MENNIKVRLYYPGESGFEFYCAGFHIMRGDNDTKHMFVNFSWEFPDGEGDYEREKGAPKAVEMMLFKLEMNKRDYENSFGMNARKIEFEQYSANGVVLKNIGMFNIDVC